MSQLEKQVEELLKKGQLPAILISPSKRLVPDKRPNGRPRIHPPGDELSTHRGRRGRRWPRCMAKGCRNNLKVNQGAACSDTCRDWLLNHALGLLQRLDITKADLLEMYEDPVLPSKPAVLTD